MYRPDDDVHGDEVRFADLNGDGRDDILRVSADGAVHAFLNRGGGGNGSFEARYDWVHASDYPRKYIQFADISAWDRVGRVRSSICGSCARS